MSRGLALAIVAALCVVGPLAGAAMAGSGGSGGSGGDEVIATLKIDSPGVQVKKASAQQFKDAKDGQKLREGDTVKTDATGRAEIDFDGAAYTRLDVNTTFTITSLTNDEGDRQVEGSLETGRTWNRTVALTESESFEQSGGGATAAVTGTAFAVECTSVDHCDFTAVVDVTTLTGKDGVVKLLQPLDQCDSTSGVLCGDITKISVDDLPGWITENLLRDLVERGLDDGGLRGTLVIEDDGSVTFLPESPPVVVGGVETPSPTPPPDEGPPPDTSTAPSAPTNVSALPGWASATVSWTPGDDGGSPITSYVVTAIPGQELESVSVQAQVQTCPVAPPATSCLLTGLTNGVTYTFTVTATNKKGTSPSSTPSNAITPPVVVPFGAAVQYTTQPPAQDWTAKEYNDDDWATESGPFTEKGEQDPCSQNPFPSGNPAFAVDGEIWVRITFELPAGFSNLQIVGTIDNIAHIFVNGQSVVSVLDGGYCEVDNIDFDITEYVEAGMNVVAIHAIDEGEQSFLDFEIRYTDPNTGEETQVGSTSSSGSTTTSTTSTTSTTTSTTTTTTTLPPESNEDTPTESEAPPE